MENVFFFHGTTTDNRRFTIAGKLIRKGLSGLLFGKKSLILGAALCSKDDDFVKKVGRAKAIGRMLGNSKKGHLCIKTNNCEYNTKSFLDYVSTFNSLKSNKLTKEFNLRKVNKI